MAGDPSWYFAAGRKIRGKIPLAGVGKLMPHSSKSVAIDQVDSNRGKGKVQCLENVVGKSESFVKVRSARRPLADLGNMSNNLNDQCRNELSNNPRIKKDRLGIKTSQGRATAGNNTYRPRQEVIAAYGQGHIIYRIASFSPSGVETLTTSKMVMTGSDLRIHSIHHNYEKDSVCKPSWWCTLRWGTGSFHYA